MIDAGQIRAARALLGWGQADLVKASGLSLTTIRRMEDDAVGPARSSGENIAAVMKALEGAGISFVAENGGGAGVRRASPRGSGPV